MNRPVWNRSAIFAVVAVGSAVIAFVWGPIRILSHIDDAFIAYRFAENLAHGHGFSYNIGERVEGFTSLAWVALVAGGIAMGFEAPMVSSVLDLASGAAALVLAYFYARAALSPERRWLATLAPWLLLSSTSFGFWATSGLETPLFVAAATLALLFDARDRPRGAAAVAALSTLVRPEGVLLGVVVLASALRKTGWKRLRSWTLPALYAAFLLGLTTFRLVYFGVPLPNTFYAKVGGVSWVLTVNYLGCFLFQLFMPLAVPFAVGAVREPKLRAGVAWLAIVFVYVAVVGADFAEHCRFFVPALPAIIAVAIRGVETCLDCRTFAERVTVATLPVAVVWYFFGPLPGACGFLVAAALAVGAIRNVWVWLGTAAISAGVAGAGAASFWTEEPKFPWWLGGRFAPRVVFTRNAELARLRRIHENLAWAALMTNDHLNRRKPKVQSVAAPGIGVLGYASSRRVIDIFGLTDPVIAHTDAPEELLNRTMPLAGHQRSNAGHILALKPDCILIGREPTAIPIPAHVALLLNPELWRLYAWDSFVGGFCRR